MDGVFLTDRTPQPKRLHTNNSEEDADFFNYEQKLREFHQESPQALFTEKDKFVPPTIKLFEKAHKTLVEKIEGGEYEEPEEEEEEIEAGVIPEEYFSLESEFLEE